MFYYNFICYLLSTLQLYAHMRFTSTNEVQCGPNRINFVSQMYHSNPEQIQAGLTNCTQRELSLYRSVFLKLIWPAAPFSAKKNLSASLPNLSIPSSHIVVMRL